MKRTFLFLFYCVILSVLPRRHAYLVLKYFRKIIIIVKSFIGDDFNDGERFAIENANGQLATVDFLFREHAVTPRSGGGKSGIELAFVFYNGNTYA